MERRRPLDGVEDAPPPAGWWEFLAVPAVAVVLVVLLLMLFAVLLYVGFIDSLVSGFDEME